MSSTITVPDSAVHSTVVWWIKRDVRLRDNPALIHARAEHPWVLPLYIFEPSVLEAPEASAFHLRACLQAVTSLRERLVREDGGIYVACDEAVVALERLHRIAPISHLYSHEETGSEVTYSRDRAVAAWCRERRVTWVEVPQNGVFRPLRDRDTRDARWAEFMRVPTLPAASPGPMPAEWRGRCAATRPPAVSDFRFAEDVGVAPDPDVQAVSEPLALATLRGFLHRRGIGYVGGISSPNTAFVHGSRLSPHLAWGTISARFVRQETLRRIETLEEEFPPGDACVQRWRRSLRAFLDRLEWRDHLMQRLEDEPAMEFRAVHPAYRDLPTIDKSDPDECHRRIACFTAGKTGFAMVDACLRCLNDTGFLNFRMRAMLTSFACQVLRLDWRTAHPLLSRRFLDYEPGLHLSQIQMQAGTFGIHTIRCYSPDKQLHDRDADLRFVRRWVPELRDVPFDLLTDREDGATLDLIEGYPPPYVNFRRERKISMDTLWAIRQSDAGKQHEADVIRRHGSRRTRGTQGPAPEAANAGG